MPHLSGTIASSLLAVLLVGCADGIRPQATRAMTPAASERQEPRVARFRAKAWVLRAVLAS